MINILLNMSPYTKQSNVTEIIKSQKITLWAWTCEGITTTVYRILVGKVEECAFERPRRRQENNIESDLKNVPPYNQGIFTEQMSDSQFMETIPLSQKLGHKSYIPKSCV